MGRVTVSPRGRQKDLAMAEKQGYSSVAALVMARTMKIMAEKYPDDDPNLMADAIELDNRALAAITGPSVRAADAGTDNARRGQRNDHRRVRPKRVCCNRAHHRRQSLPACSPADRRRIGPRLTFITDLFFALPCNRNSFESVHTRGGWHRGRYSPAENPISAR